MAANATPPLKPSSGTGNPGSPAGTGTPAAVQPPAAVVQPPAAATKYSVNLQRIPATVDPLSSGLSATVTGQIQALRTSATQKIYLGIKQIQQQLPSIITILTNPVVPSPLMGQLLEPDGTPASGVQVEFDPSQANSQSSVVTAITGNDGSFKLAIPSNLAFPTAGVMLSVRGADTQTPATIKVVQSQVAPNGYISNLKLANSIAPLPVSIIASLTSLLPALALPNPTNGSSAGTSKPMVPQLTLGESGSCQLKFQSNYSVDSFPYSVFYRLVEPQLSISNITQPVQDTKTNNLYYMPNYVELDIAAPANNAGATPPVYIDRIPVEQPISVDGFRDNVMGLDSDGYIVAEETVPMAGTLGLGYILTLAQKWTTQGLALGDLVYSLPLAPGEQQQLAVFERTDTAQVSESETFSEAQAQQQSALADTSTLATFNSAVSQVQNGGSQFSTDSTNSSWGVGGGIGGGLIGGIGALFGGIAASGGSGSTSSSGNSSEWLQGQLNTAQSAAQQTHSAAENQASARRTAARTGMRIATASEAESITTTTITNHNHTRSLTMQYWEVLRLFGVTTAVEGVTLTCLIPLQVIRFLPPGQPLTLANQSVAASFVGNREAVLTRYSALLKHIDVLQQAVPRAYQYGLTLLRQFASDPTAEVAEFGGAAEDVISLTLRGTFLECERIYVSAVTRRNTRVGPVQLTGTAPAIPTNLSSQDALVAALSRQRNGGPTTLSASLALPQTMNRNDVVGFEISRNFIQLDYTLVSPEIQALATVNSIFAGSSGLAQAIESLGQTNGNLAPATVHLTPSDLEAALSGPTLANFHATITDPAATSGFETYANISLAGVQLPQQPFPVPAEQLAPVLQYNEILEIEKTAQHVVRNTINYSKAVWLSMTPEERAILFEGYTIGVPQGGISNWTQMIPLLNCIENRVLGFFGNSMIVPFMIPPNPQANGDGAAAGITSAQVQDALISYYKKAFVPPLSNIALPTRGVLGEAVLGSCPAAEKIDLTRFWNWADSPADSAPAIAGPVLPTTTSSIAAGLSAPNSLGSLPPLINNVLTAPTPDTTLLQALAKTASSVQAVDPSLTGAAQLASLITNSQNTAASARADALKTTQALASSAMTAAQTLLSQKMATDANASGAKTGNPTIGSSALAALNPNASSQQQSAAGQPQPTQQGANAGQGNRGGGTTNPPPATGPTVSVTVSPASTTVPTTGPAVQFAAQVVGSNDTAVTWTVAGGDAGGKINPGGMYTPPTSAGVYSVIATSDADNTKKASATVTVTP